MKISRFEIVLDDLVQTSSSNNYLRPRFLKYSLIPIDANKLGVNDGIITQYWHTFVVII